MSKRNGFIFTVLFIPALYAAMAYFGAVNKLVIFCIPYMAPEFAIMVATPLVISGLGKWWDIWVRPGPKLGMPYASLHPNEFVTSVCTTHGVIIIVALIGVALSYAMKDYYVHPDDQASLEAEHASISQQLKSLDKNPSPKTAKESNIENTHKELSSTKDDAVNAEVNRKLQQAKRVEENQTERTKLEGRLKDIDDTLLSYKSMDFWADKGSLYAPYLLLITVFISTFNSPGKSSFSSGQPIQK